MLSELLNKVLVQYSSAREKEPFSGHELGEIVRSTIPEALINSAPKNNNYLIKGSIGHGKWATVPWIAVMDGRITTTTRDGVYIVYLFAEDGSALYLTLNQGCTETIRKHGRRKTEEILIHTAENLRNQLSIPNELFAERRIHIGNKYYEKGCIAYRCYECNVLPADNILLDDLSELCAMYEQYYESFNKIGTTLDKKNSANVRIPLGLHEAAILLEAYISSSRNNRPRRAVAEETSKKLRCLAVGKGIAIDDGFRSPTGIQGRLRSIGAIYEGIESPSAPGTQVFVEAVNLYRNNPAQFHKLLLETSEWEGRQERMSNDKTPTPEQEFFHWLSITISPAVLKDITKLYKLISTMLVQKKLLSQPLASITMVVEVEGALRQLKKAFASKKHRNTTSKLLTAYIAYLKEKENNILKIATQLENEIQEDWILFDFANYQQFERTVPVYCLVDGNELSGKNWARILVALAEMEITRDNPQLKELYKKALIAQRKSRPFFLKRRIDGLNCSQLSNGYWININYSIPRLMQQIQALCLHCGYNKDQVFFYGAPKGNTSIVSENSAVPKQSGNGIDIIKAEEYLISVGLCGATVKELIDAVQPSASVSPTQKALDDSLNAICMPGNRYVHAESFVDLDEAEEILGRILSTHFVQFGGYSNNQLLFGAASRDLSMFLNDNDCENIDSVFAIARFLFEKKAVTGHTYKFYVPHIFESEPDFPMNLKGIMINLARNNGGILLADEAKDYLRKTMMSYGSLGQLLQISTTDTFLMYDSERYLLAEKVGIDDLWIQFVHDRLDHLFQQADVAYIVPRDISHTWLDTLPPLPPGLRWTQLLLQEILKKFSGIGFCAITPELNQTYDTIAAAIVPANSPLQSFPDVVNLFMQERYTLPMKIAGEDLRLELRDAGMLEGNELIYALPKALNDYRFAWSNENKTVYVRGN